LAARKHHCRLEGVVLVIGLCFEDTFLMQQGDQRRHTVIAQSARVNGGRYEVVTECVHFDYRGHPNSIAAIISIDSTSHAGTGHWFSSQETRLESLLASFPNERE